MKRILALIVVLCASAGLAAAQTTTYNGVIKDLTQTAVPTGQVLFTLKPGIDTTTSGSSRFVPSTIFCEIHNPAVVSTSGTGTITVVVGTAQTWQAGDSILFAGTADATLNANTVATPYVITLVNSTTSYNFTQSGAHTNGAVGTVGGLYASGGTGGCKVTQNTTLTPANTSYNVGIQAVFAQTASFNTYAIGSGPVDISTIVPTPGQMPAYSFMDLFSNQTVTGIKTFSGNNPHSGAETFAKLNGVVYLDGTTNITLANCYAAIPAGGGACVVPPNYTETLAASLTINKANSGFIFTGPAAITMGTNQVIVTAGTHGVFFYGQTPLGGAGTTQGAIFSYSGSSKAFQIGASSAATRAFGWSNVAVNLTGGAIGAASALYLTSVIYFDIQNFASANTSASTTTTGLVCDGTGLFCGNGRIGNPQIINHKVAILGTGSGGANCMNAVEISGDQRIDNPGAISGAIGIDLECANDNIILSADIESQSIGVKLGAGAVDNRGTFRTEVNTTDIQALGGSSANRFDVQTVNGTTAVVVSDAGTNNHFSRMIDGNFSAITASGLQAPSGGAGVLTLSDTNGLAVASISPGFFRIANSGFLAMGASAKIEDAPTGTIMGLTLKKGSGAGSYTTASTTYVVADSTNLCFTVTIPTGWKLSVTASGSIGTATAVALDNFALTDNAACATANAGILVEGVSTTTAAGVLQPFALNWVIAGDGAVHNIALQYKTSAGADSATILNSSATSLPTMTFTLMPSS